MNADEVITKLFEDLRNRFKAKFTEEEIYQAIGIYIYCKLENINNHHDYCSNEILQTFAMKRHRYKYLFRCLRFADPFVSNENDPLYPIRSFLVLFKVYHLEGVQSSIGKKMTDFLKMDDRYAILN